MDGVFPSLNENISTEETLRIIDEAIEKHQRATDEPLATLLALKSRRNASVPISCLPPEILCKIFSFAAISKLDSIGQKVDPVEWINLTYVCRHWRNVAVNEPSLWVDPPIGKREWLRQMIRRSKDRSLIIQVGPYDIGWGIELALKHIHRIRELSIRSIGASRWLHVQKALIMKSAPRLERLFLQGENESRPLFISEDILCKTPGPLRHLELEYCALGWDSHLHLLSSLTSLKLHHIEQTYRPDATRRFVDVLKGMPDLEVLDLYYSLPFPGYEAEQQSSQNSEHVHFARLQTLFLCDSPFAIETFVHYVSFPPTAMVKICVDPILNDDDDDNGEADNPNYSGIISGLVRSYSNQSPEATFQSLILRRPDLTLPQTEPPEYDIGVRLMLFTELLKGHDMITHVAATPRLELAFYCAPDPQTITQLMSDIFTGGMILDRIMHACLFEKIVGLKSATIANTLGRLPAHSVVVVGDAARSFLNAARVGSHVLDAIGSDGNTVQTLSFPDLSSIYMHNVTFVDAHLLDLQENLDALSIDLLQDFLMQRCDFHRPIDMLSLTGRLQGVLEKDLKLLEEIVVDVNTSTVDWNEEDEDK